MPGRLVRRIVPALAAVLAGEGREERPRLAVVAALEDARRLDADEQPVARARERRDLRDLAAVLVAVGEALARLLPRLAEVAAAPDGRAVPLARGGGVDRAGRRVVDRVVDRPALAVRAAHRPVAAVVALEQERALAGCDGQQGLRHRFAPRSRDLSRVIADSATRPSETHRSRRPWFRAVGQPASGLPVSSSVFRPLRTNIQPSGDALGRLRRALELVVVDGQEREAAPALDLPGDAARLLRRQLRVVAPSVHGGRAGAAGRTRGPPRPSRVSDRREAPAVAQRRSGAP